MAFFGGRQQSRWRGVMQSETPHCSLCRRFVKKRFVSVAEMGAKKLVVHMAEEWFLRRYLKGESPS